MWHYLIECPAYDTEPAILQTESKNFDLSLKILLSMTKGMEATIAFVRRTGCFNNPFRNLEGDLVAPKRVAVLKEKQSRLEEKRDKRKAGKERKGWVGAG